MGANGKVRWDGIHEKERMERGEGGAERKKGEGKRSEREGREECK